MQLEIMSQMADLGSGYRSLEERDNWAGKVRYELDFSIQKRMILITIEIPLFTQLL